MAHSIVGVGDVLHDFRQRVQSHLHRPERGALGACVYLSSSCISLQDKHATPFGLACLLVCLLAAFFYQQAPMQENAKQQDSAQDAEGGKDTLLPK